MEAVLGFSSGGGSSRSQLKGQMDPLAGIPPRALCFCWSLSSLQERCPPCVDDFLYICDDAYKREELLAMEVSILQTLRFDINIPIAYRFLRRFAKVSGGPGVLASGQKGNPLVGLRRFWGTG